MVVPLERPQVLSADLRTGYVEVTAPPGRRSRHQCNVVWREQDDVHLPHQFDSTSGQAVDLDLFLDRPNRGNRLLGRRGVGRVILTPDQDLDVEADLSPLDPRFEPS